MSAVVLKVQDRWGIHKPSIFSLNYKAPFSPVRLRIGKTSEDGERGTMKYSIPRLLAKKEEETHPNCKSMFKPNTLP